MTVDVNARNAFRKLNQARMGLFRASEATIENLTQLGKARAKSRAPFFSGKTARMIRAIKRKTATGHESIIISPNSVKSDGHTRRHSDFNLPRWMHTSPKARRHIKSGDRRYMYSTAAYLNRIKNKVAKGHFNKTILR